MEKILVSSCLLGEAVRYDGTDCRVEGALSRWQQQARVVAICPEMAGGLSVPRLPAEIEGGQGLAVLDGSAEVIASSGISVSRYFLQGASRALALCEQHNIRLAILKSRSPSCGNERCYDGRFTGMLVAGQGVTAALLTRNGIRVYSELQLTEAEDWLSKYES